MRTSLQEPRRLESSTTTTGWLGSVVFLRKPSFDQTVTICRSGDERGREDAVARDDLGRILERLAAVALDVDVLVFAARFLCEGGRRDKGRSSQRRATCQGNDVKWSHGSPRSQAMCPHYPMLAGLQPESLTAFTRGLPVDQLGAACAARYCSRQRNIENFRHFLLGRM